MVAISASTLISILVFVCAVLAVLLIITVAIAVILFIITAALIVHSLRRGRSDSSLGTTSHHRSGKTEEMKTLMNDPDDLQTYDRPAYAPPKIEGGLRSADNSSGHSNPLHQNKRNSTPLRSPSSTDKLNQMLPRATSSVDNLKDYQSQSMPRVSSRDNFPRNYSGNGLIPRTSSTTSLGNSELGDDVILKEDTSGHPAHPDHDNVADAAGGLVLPGEGDATTATTSSTGNSQMEPLSEDFSGSFEVTMAEKLRVVSVISEQLELLEQVGSGSSSQVFKAVYFGAIVAVKKCLICDLLEDPLKDYMKETDILSSLNHPNIIKFYGASLQPPYFYIITEFCENGSLDRYVKTASTIAPAQDGVVQTMKKQFTMIEKVRMMLETALGMEYLQSVKVPIVHRDLKLANLLVDSNWTLKVTDFGVSNFLNKERKMTKVGTIETQAPEVIKDGQYSKKTDVYAYGVTMWEFIFEKELYPGLSIYEIQSKVVGQNMRPIIPKDAQSALKKEEMINLAPEDRNKRPPMQLINLMKRCWDKNPKNRPNFKKIVTEMQALYQDMIEQQHAIDELNQQNQNN